jgi:hypothetical protein
MKRITLLLLALSLAFCLSAQIKKSQIDVPAGKNLREVLSNSLQYVEPDFLLGKVYYKDKSVSEGFFNYNILLNEMHFVFYDKESDTDRVLSLANPETIDFITFGKRLFVFDKRYGYVEVIFNGKIKLLKKSTLEVVSGDRPRDSYGYLPESAASSKLDYFGGENFIYAPDREEILKANTKREDRYYSQKAKSIKPISSKKSLLSLSSKKHSDELSKFIDDLPGKWNDEQNLFEYFKFANKFENE